MDLALHMIRTADPSLTPAEASIHAKASGDLYAVPLGMNHLPGLSPASILSLCGYSVAGYGKLNEPLREGTPLNDLSHRAVEISQMHQHMHDCSRPLIKPMTVWRGVTFDKPLKDVYKKNNWTDPGWVSTSLCKKIATSHSDIFYTRREQHEHAYLAKMTIMPGVNVVPMGAILHYHGLKNGGSSCFTKEKEITLAPNLIYRVTDRELIADEAHPPYTLLEVEVSTPPCKRSRIIQIS